MNLQQKNNKIYQRNIDIFSAILQSILSSKNLIFTTTSINIIKNKRKSKRGGQLEKI